MFLKLKKINSIFKNTPLDFKKALAWQLWSSANLPPKNIPKLSKRFILLFKFLLRTIYNSIVTTPIIKSPKTGKSNILIIRNHSRPNIENHVKHFENIEDTSTCVFKNRKIKIDIFPFFYCIFFLLKSRKSWIEVFKFYEVKFFSINGFNVLIYFFNSLSDSIKILPNLLDHSKLVSFQEMVTVENIICQIANNNKIKTFALQHAMSHYNETISSYEKDRLINCTYKPTVCQNILVWGDYNKNIFKKYTDSKIFIIGKPDMPEIETPLEGVTLIFQDKIFEDHNNKLFEINKLLIDRKLPISLWFKPGHVLIENRPLRDGPLRKIVIGVTSSLCFELGFLGLQVFILKSKSVDQSIPESLMLDDIDLIANNYKTLENYPHNLWKNFIECSNDETIKRYKNIVLYGN